MPMPMQRRIWENRREMREGLCNAYSAFVHETPEANLGSILENGLQARNPGPSMRDALIEKLLGSCPRILCLHPQGADLRPGSNQDGPYVMLGIKAEALPEDVTLDWSFDGCWELVPELEQSNTREVDVFLDIVRRRGAVAVLGNLEPEALYVMCQELQEVMWRPLLAASCADIIVYEGDRRPIGLPVDPPL